MPPDGQHIELRHVLVDHAAAHHTAHSGSYLGTLLIVSIPHQPVPSLLGGVRHIIDTDIDHHCSRLEPIADGEPHQVQS